MFIINPFPEQSFIDLWLHRAPNGGCKGLETHIILVLAHPLILLMNRRNIVLDL